MNGQSAPMSFFPPRTEAVLAGLLVAGALCFLFLFGIVGLFRSGVFGFDFIVFHKAGVEFLHGVNPWLAAVDTGAPFSYPPQLASLISFYGALSFKTALYIHTAISLCAVASIALLANRWFLGITSLSNMSLAQGLCLSFLIGNPFVAHSLYEGQWTIVAVAMLYWSWHFLQKEKWILSGLFLGVATIKPQVSILYVIWLLFGLNFRVLFVGGLLAVLMLLPAISVFGVFETFSSWFVSMDDYMQQFANKPGSPYVVGFEGVFVSMGVEKSGIVFKMLSILSVLALYIKRKQLSPLLIVNGFLVSALSFIYGHDTDYVTLSLLWSYFLFLAFKKQSYIALGVAIATLFVMFFPQRVIRAMDISMLVHSRTLVVLLCCWFVYIWDRELNFTEQH